MNVVIRPNKHLLAGICWQLKVAAVVLLIPPTKTSSRGAKSSTSHDPYCRADLSDEKCLPSCAPVSVMTAWHCILVITTGGYYMRHPNWYGHRNLCLWQDLYFEFWYVYKRKFRYIYIYHYSNRILTFVLI